MLLKGRRQKMLARQFKSMVGILQSLINTGGKPADDLVRLKTLCPLWRAIRQGLSCV